MSRVADEYSAPLLGAIDQGTSSTRFLIFSARTGALITLHQIELKQHCPLEGWVEMDAQEIWQTTQECITKAIESLKSLSFDPQKLCAVGIANQRETTLVWDRLTGKPLSPAIVWLDQRTKDLAEDLTKQTSGNSKDALRSLCGLPIHPYFSALKLKWILLNLPEAQKALAEERLLAGTIDSWLIWNLSGGKQGGVHITDVTNASRTMLMNLRTLQWDNSLCRFFMIPQTILPEIKSSSEIYAFITDGPLKDVPISGCLGDQQAALLGQGCLQLGSAKNTYGTGCFLLYNVGTKPLVSSHGLLTTVAFKLGPDKPAFYALEGSVAIAGACVRWLRDNLQIIRSSDDIEELAGSVKSTHGVYFVPAFSGLYAPYWQPDARGIICGLSQYSTGAHIALATLEAACFQTKEMLDAMNLDCGRIPIVSLQVDGGMTKNDLLMQLQADLLGVVVKRPQLAETTALGAAIAAGLASGIAVWDMEWHKKHPPPSDNFQPRIAVYERELRSRRWRAAVQRAMGWVTGRDGEPAMYDSRGSSSPGRFAHIAKFVIPIGVVVMAAITIYHLPKPDWKLPSWLSGWRLPFTIGRN